MKKVLSLFLTLTILLNLTGCSESGTTSVYLNGDENNLPPELKGLKVYQVYVENNVAVYVAVLNNQVNSVSTIGKHARTTIMVNPSDVIYETDSVILIRK